MKNRPSANLYHGFDRCGHWERTLFGLARDVGAGMSSVPIRDAVEDEYGRAVVVSFDDVPGL
jgi:hypothetical protein